MKDLIKPLEERQHIFSTNIRFSEPDVRELEQNYREVIEDDIENMKLLKHLLSFPALKDCVGQMTIDMVEGRLFSIEQLLEKLTGQKWEDLKNMEV